jgi:uncharacterized SAM-binding protein YcdF (DUF218 family)
MTARPGSLSRRIAGASVHLGWIAVGVFILGFFLFADHATRSPPRTLPDGEAIVVLTGDGARVPAGMQLLEHGVGERLFVTGVNPQVTDEELAALAAGAREAFDCCVDVDRAAADTIGNATQTARWARARGFTRIVVVTADYHMPRSLQELHAAMPEGRFIAYPVRAVSGRGPWWTRAGYWRRLPPEYVKYLLAHVRLWLIAPAER